MRTWRVAQRNARTFELLRRFSCSSKVNAARQTSVAELLRGEGGNKENTTVQGWVRSVRRQKRIAFAAVGDGSTVDSIQAVLTPDAAAELSTGAAVRLKGVWTASHGKAQSHELQVSDVEVMGENDAERNPLQPKFQTPEYLRTIPHLRSRIPSNALLLRLRSRLIASITRFFDDQGFVQTHTPVITSSDCEGAGEVFSISSNTSNESASHWKLENRAQMDNFFRTPKYLTVSAQLHLEALAQAVDRVWTLAPTFRAEKSDTPRHLSEFYMLEAEMCFVDDLSQVIDVVETMLRASIKDVHDRGGVFEEIVKLKQEMKNDESVDHGGKVDAETLRGRWDGLLAEQWPRITYSEAIKALQDAKSNNSIAFAFNPTYEDGLQAEHERYIASTIGQGKPVFVTDYPRAQKPFYMPASTLSRNSKGTAETAACFDLLVPDLCELVGGSLREHRSNKLRQAMQAKGVAGGNLEWYEDLRKYGSVPHGGFGLGFDRLLCYLAGVNNVRDVVAFPRWYARCDC